MRWHQVFDPRALHATQSREQMELLTRGRHGRQTLLGRHAIAPPVGIDGATNIITATSWSWGGNVQGQPSRQLTVTFGSGGPGAMGFGFAESEARAKKAA